MSFSLNIPNLFKSSTATAEPTLTPEQALFTIKKNLLAQAAQTARAENRKPTLEDYRLAAVAFGQTEEGARMVANHEWGMKIAADLSGQTLDGFLITDPTRAPAAGAHA